MKKMRIIQPATFVPGSYAVEGDTGHIFGPYEIIDELALHTLLTEGLKEEREEFGFEPEKLLRIDYEHSYCISSKMQFSLEPLAATYDEDDE